MPGPIEDATVALDLFTACMQAARGDNYKRVRPGMMPPLVCPACAEKIEINSSVLAQ